ncbi:calcium-binding protein [Nitrosomonas sp.]|uniref:calcium-binding protein n=1 Tax=Nitrosomonas sp. TaxID=42353 RepID=UPI0025FA26C7|nr:calcium-binding protein [Nitrosomonas sp.]
MDGGPSNDIAAGEAGDDILMGGMGKDVLMGLGGDDTIEGDIDFTAGNSSWLVTRSVTSENNSTAYRRDYNFPTTHSTVDANTGDNDVIYSGTGKDWIFTQGGNDFADAGADDDVVFGEGGNDFILGQLGDDVLIGDSHDLDTALHGADYIDGGDGIDTIWGDGGADHLLGGTGDDKLVGDGDYIPVPYQGNDVLDGGGGNDELTGGYGNDTLIGGTGSDRLYGGPGDDTYLGVENGDFIGDIEGKNTIVLADKNNQPVSAPNLPIGFTLTALTEPVAGLTNAPSSATWLSDVSVLRITLENGDTLDLQAALYGMDAQIRFDQGAQGIDMEAWVGEHLHDAVSLSLNFDWAAAGLQQPATYLYSGTGNDFLYGDTGNDTIKGYGGNDQLLGNAGDDRILGGLGSDVLVGEDGADTLQGEAGADQLQGGLGDDNLDGGSGDDTLFGQEGGDTLNGGDNNDELQGGLGNDTLMGDAGNDNLFGQEGNDVLDGGAGNDVLQGNSGDDVYRFDLGGGRDEIWEEGDSSGDVLHFGENIVPSDITVAKSGNHLLLFHVNGADQVTINNWYLDSSWRLMQFEFADGTIWNGNTIGNLAMTTLRGTAGDDVIYGDVLNETLIGLDGNDNLRGNDGNDTLIGGKGNDFLHGGAGSNTYLFALGDGADRIDPYTSDTLRFAVDISSTDITVERAGNDLVLHHQNGSDSVTIINWYLNIYDRLQQVIFDADGTVWPTATLDQMGINFSNQYTFNVGDGAKTIEDSGGTDSLTFGAGISDADITIARVGQNLKLTHVNGSDSVMIKDWFNNLSKQIETIRFLDSNTVLTAAQHTTPFLTLTGTAANDVIQGGDAYGETLAGLGGNDTLNGGQGADIYLFNQGDGQDTITDTSSPWYDENSIVFGEGLLARLNVTFASNNDIIYSFDTDSVRIKVGSGVSPQFVSSGTAAADTLNGSSYRDIIHGLAGNDTIYGNVSEDELHGDTGNDTIIGGEDTDWLYGGDGDDVLDGYLLTGGSDDQTYGSDSTDYYVGGAGNDTLYGNSRDDSYYFNLGDGNDVIIEGAFYLSGYWYYSYSDTLIFGSGITANSIKASKLNNDLVITVTATDTVTIKNWFSDYKLQLESFRFADGSTLTAAEISQMVNTLRGTAGDDVLTLGTSADGVLYGEGGNDTLTGGSGDDAIYGGSGNDALNGGSGNDSYFLSRNSGQDVISDTSGSDTVRFDASVTATDFALSRSGNDLVLTRAASGDKLTIKDYLNGNLSLFIYAGSNTVNFTNLALIESFIFADGSVMRSQTSIQDSLLNIRGAADNNILNGTAWADVMYGDGGDDELYGFADDDVLYGGNGNDFLDGGAGDVNLLYGQDGDDVLIGEGGTGFGQAYLHGGMGNDTYVFKSNAYFDIYDDSGSDDKIVFEGNIGLSGLSFQRWGNELDILVNGGGRINIPNHFQSNSYQVERLTLADGTVLGLRDIQMGTGAKDTLNGTIEDSILLGDYDTDTLNGNDGNDWLDGGASGDTMTGGNGNDIYFVDAAKDNVTELAGQGFDTVVSAISYTLGANVERLMLTGASNINGTGNALDNFISGNSAINTLTGNDGNDYLDGQGGIDKMVGGAGNDIYVVDNASETLTERSNEGTDTIISRVTLTLPNYIENLTLTGTLPIQATGNTLNNVLTGNAANNTLTGSKGGDTYQLGRGSGTDTAIENDTTANTIDTAQFLTGIAADQIWFQHAGNNLEISIIGTTDKLIVKDWYLGSAYHIEQFKTAAGLTLQHSNVETLVNAMASFAPPSLGQTILPAAYESSLDPVIASLWV